MGTRTDSRIYVGRLEGGRQVVYAVDAIGVEQLQAPPAGFGWGADAAGQVLDLARVLLADASRTNPPPAACVRFATQILARLPHDGFTLQRDTISAWLRRSVAV